MNELTKQTETTTALNVVEGIERAQIDMQIATARRYPRQLSNVKADMLSFATLDEETASSCFYTLPRGGKTIQGPSVRLAEIAVACYQNLRAGSRVVSVSATGDNPHVIVQSVAHDLEKNVAITIEKRRRIVGKKSRGGAIDDDDINLACNACSAIAFRDAVFKVVPLALVKPVFEAAKKVAVGEVKSLAEKRSKVIERLKQMGVSEERILSTIDCRKIDDIGMDKLEVLIGLGTALKDGEVTLEEAFPQKPIEVAKPKFIKEQPQEKPVAVEPERTQEPESEREVETPQQRLFRIVTSAGFTYEDLVKWGEASGMVPDATSYPDIEAWPARLCDRLCKAEKGLIDGIKRSKGGE